MPVVENDLLPTIGNAGDVVLADLSYAMYGTPRDIMVAASEHVKFMEDRTAYRVTTSFAFMPWIDAPITLENGWTVSPFVGLQ